MSDCDVLKGIAVIVLIVLLVILIQETKGYDYD